MKVVRLGGDGASHHVYVDKAPTRTRAGLVALLREREWEIQCVDPADFRPLRDGLLVEGWIIGSNSRKRTEEAIELIRNNRKGALNDFQSEGFRHF